MITTGAQITAEAHTDPVLTESRKQFLELIYTALMEISFETGYGQAVATKDIEAIFTAAGLELK